MIPGCFPACEGRATYAFMVEPSATFSATFSVTIWSKPGASFAAAREAL